MVIALKHNMLFFCQKQYLFSKNNFKNTSFIYLRLIVLFFILLSSFININAQKNSRDSYFGFQVKPIFPGVFIGTTQFDSEKNGFSTSFAQAMGFSFGGILRLAITQSITIETGINFTQRKYRFSSSLPDSNVFIKSKIRYLTYDIPASVLVYLPINNEWYMNASIGAALVYNPTPVGVRRTVSNTLHQVSQLGVGRKLFVEMLANVGCEYRHKKHGIFYLGATARIPFVPLFILRSEYSNQGLKIQTDPDVQGKVDGSYIAIELKYFFPIIDSKGSPIKTPIE